MNAKECKRRDEMTDQLQLPRPKTARFLKHPLIEQLDLKDGVIAEAKKLFERGILVNGHPMFAALQKAIADHDAFIIPLT
jgi:hypothetical protein